MARISRKSNSAWEISITYASLSISQCYRRSKKRGKMTEILLLSQKISWVCRPFVLPGGYFCEQLHLADTGKLYQKVLQPFFSKLTWLNLKSKGPLSPQVGVTKHWDWLNIESCMEISLTSNIQSLRASWAFLLLFVHSVLTTLYKTFVQGE